MPLPDELFKPSQEELDDLPLIFGKYKGSTPNEVANNLPGRRYLVWAYETISNKPVCSGALYRKLGGTKGNYKEIKEQERERKFQREQESRTKNFGFDPQEFDDDVPF